MASIQFIRRFIASQDRVVEYKPDGATRCPVCEFCGLEHGRVTVYQTRDEIRYCNCSQCLATFRATGKPPEEIKAEKIEAVKISAEIENKNKKIKQGKPKKRKRN